MKDPNNIFRDALLTMTTFDLLEYKKWRDANPFQPPSRDQIDRFEAACRGVNMWLDGYSSLEHIVFYAAMFNGTPNDRRIHDRVFHHAAHVLSGGKDNDIGEFKAFSFQQEHNLWDHDEPFRLAAIEYIRVYNMPEAEGMLHLIQVLERKAVDIFLESTILKNTPFPPTPIPIKLQEMIDDTPMKLEYTAISRGRHNLTKKEQIRRARRQKLQHTSRRGNR